MPPYGWDAGYTVTLTNSTILSRAVTCNRYHLGIVKTITNAFDGRFRVCGGFFPSVHPK